MTALSLTDERVLITGGAGFIGTALASALVPQTTEVVLLDSLHPDVHGDDPQPPAISGTRFVRGDVTSPQVWQQLLKELSPTAIVHLAAETGTGLSFSQATRHAHVNVVGTTTMLDALFRVTHRPKPHRDRLEPRRVRGGSMEIWRSNVLRGTTRARCSG